MFDSHAFLKDHFGSPPGVRRMLKAYGLPVPSYAAAQKWFGRGVTPGAWLPVLVAVRELETGEPVTLAKYLTLGDR